MRPSDTCAPPKVRAAERGGRSDLRRCVRIPNSEYTVADKQARAQQSALPRSLLDPLPLAVPSSPPHQPLSLILRPCVSPSTHLSQADGAAAQRAAAARTSIHCELTYPLSCRPPRRRAGKPIEVLLRRVPVAAAVGLE